MIKTSYIRRAPTDRKRKAQGVVYFRKEWVGKVCVIIPRSEYSRLMKQLKKRIKNISIARRWLAR